MINLQPTSITPPNVPQSKVAQAKPSFKGEEDRYDDFEGRDSWEQNKRDFQDFSENPKHPKAISKIGKAGLIVVSGVLGYGTAKFGFNKCIGMATDLFKSAKVQAAKGKIESLVKEAIVPNAKKATSSVVNYVKESKFGKSIIGNTIKAFNSVKGSAIGKNTGKAYDAVIGNRAVDKTIKMTKGGATKSYDAVKGFVTDKTKMSKVGQYTIEGLAVGSGFAAAVESIQLVPHDQDQYREAV